MHFGNRLLPNTEDAFLMPTEGRCIKLEAGDITKYEGEKFETHHEWLINERHNFSAHAGDSDSDVFEVRLALKPLSKGKQRLQFYIFRNLVISPEIAALNAHKELVSHVISVVDRKLDGIYVRINQDYENRDIDNLYDAAKHIIA
ncbi:MAG: hypothetical protein HC889_14340 [Synechococcaceae cyanobacterium SM1_2_3]|nr:hypothetical protein [Synechococcaceae cyanobacterium SM1_2_3]